MSVQVLACIQFMQWVCDSVVYNFKAVHVCACTYMHAAQGQAYTYGYIYAFGKGLLSLS